MAYKKFAVNLTLIDQIVYEIITNQWVGLAYRLDRKLLFGQPGMLTYSRRKYCCSNTKILLVPKMFNFQILR